MMSGKKSYWNYLCDCLSSNKYLKDGLRFVRSLTEVCLHVHCGCAAACTFIKQSLHFSVTLSLTCVNFSNKHCGKLYYLNKNCCIILLVVTSDCINNNGNVTEVNYRYDRTHVVYQ